jgi:hypothetical protein
MAKSRCRALECSPRNEEMMRVRSRTPFVFEFLYLFQHIFLGCDLCSVALRLETLLRSLDT